MELKLLGSCGGLRSLGALHAIFGTAHAALFNTGGVDMIRSMAPAPDGHAKSVIDPVCGMTVDPATAEHRSSHGGETYYFCSAGCKQSFDRDPGKYALPREGTHRSSG